MPNVYIETYGCQMNVSDSELMLGKLIAEGYTSIDGPEGADVILLNTCAIRDNAEQRVIGRLGEIRRFMGKDTILGVTGCMAQRLGPRLLETDSRVSLVVGPDAYRSLPHLIEAARTGERFTATDLDLEEHYEDFQARRFEGVKPGSPCNAAATIGAPTASSRTPAVPSGAVNSPTSYAKPRRSSRRG